jgi:thiazole biosynthesis enzyme
MSQMKIAPTRHIAREYYKEFDQLIESDVIIVGAGPSGLLCARDLAKQGFKTLLIEQGLALGGGFWSGGYLMNKAAICAPADLILEELGIPYKPIKECDGMTMVDPPHATARLIAAAYEAGAKVMNLTRVLDLIVREAGSLEGAQRWRGMTLSMWIRSLSKAALSWMPQDTMPSWSISSIAGTFMQKFQVMAQCGLPNPKFSW